MIIGIDPGLTGAIAVLDDGKFKTVHDMPKQQKGKTTRKRNRVGIMVDKKKYEVDGQSLGELLVSILPESITNPAVYLEEVSAMVGKNPDGSQRTQGVASTFSFGDSFGGPRMLCEFIFGKTCFFRVRPQAWKKATHLSGLDKDAARLMARGLYPEAQEFLTRKKDSGRADAIMIAHYGYLQQLKESDSASCN